MNTNLIYGFSTHPTKDGYIGKATITYDVILTLLKEKVKNSIRKIFTGEDVKIRLWAIDDSEFNYTIYIENEL